MTVDGIEVKTWEPHGLRRPEVCPGCCAALIRGRRAKRGPLCPDCLRDLVREMDRRSLIDREVCLAHLEPEPCQTCAAYIAAGL